MENIDLMFTLDEVNGTGSAFLYRNELSEGTGGLYSVYFANCEAQALVTLDAVVSLWNSDEKGGRDFLSEGEQALPSLYLMFFLIFAAAGSYWSFLVLKKHKATAHKIHQVMIVLVAFKALRFAVRERPVVRRGRGGRGRGGRGPEELDHAVPALAAALRPPGALASQG